MYFGVFTMVPVTTVGSGSAKALRSGQKPIKIYL